MVIKGDSKKLKVGFFGVSGCAGCLLSVIFEEQFKEISEMIDIKSFPLIKEENYEGDFDYIFVEGTVCFDEDIISLTQWRKRTKYLVALGSCACFGGVPSIKNFMDEKKIKTMVYPKYNHLKEEDPTPLDRHVKVDFYLPQCPPSKEEIVIFIKGIVLGKSFKQYQDPVCFECRKKGNKCLLEEGKLCLGPVTNGGCNALCPSNGVACYGCRGPCKDANFKSFLDLLKSKGYTKKEAEKRMEIFAGLQFEDGEGEQITTWLEK